MTMIDENALRDALRVDAEAIEIPEGAAERILTASRVAAPEAGPRHPRPLPDRGQRRRLLVAAVVIVVVGGITLSLVAVHQDQPRVAASAASSGSSQPLGPTASGTAGAPPVSTGPPTPLPRPVVVRPRTPPMVRLRFRRGR